MRLRLDIDGFVLHIKISGYEPSIESVWDEQWCSVDFSIVCEPWLNYYMNNYHILLSCEIEGLATALGDLLNDKVTEAKTIECIEPDFSFVLNPKFNNESSTIDIDMEMKISFWNDGALTSNFLSLSFDREDIEYLRNYLFYVMNKLDKKSSVIKNMILEEVLLPEYLEK